MYIAVFITVPHKKEANCIAKELTRKKLAACVNIVENVHSLFWWQGRVNMAGEALLIVKTRKALLSKLIKKVKSLHSYEVPEIIALPIIAGNREYLQWLNECTK